MELIPIEDKIYEIRGRRVMLDFDLAEMYGIETPVFRMSSNEKDIFLSISLLQNIFCIKGCPAQKKA